MTLIRQEITTDAKRLQDVRELDWTTRGLWISLLETVEVTKGNSTKSTRVVIRRGSGDEVEIAVDDLNAAYVQIGPHEWHSRFRPVLAISAKDDATFFDGAGMTITVEAGGAVLNDDGSFSAISNSDYDRIYTVVGHRGQPKPVAPFTY